MFNDLYENLNRYSYGPKQESIIGLLQKTWANISADYITNYLKWRRCYETVSEHDVCSVDLPADEVRSAVYSNIRVMENHCPDLVNEWFDLSIDEQDAFLVKAFPGNQVYGV